tara:strand:+ start:7750 stop:7911 length:162 start_codon:yes stop_codon:yes gene_type:complete
MNNYHLTYYLHRKPTPLLTGVTIEADNLIKAVAIWLLECKDNDVSQIKYVLEL